MPRPLPRSTPEAVGLSSSALLSLIGRIERQEMHGLMVLRHGKVVAEGAWSPFDLKTPHLLYSLSKSFCASAVGIAVEEGLLTLDDRVIAHFQDLAPVDPSENLRQMRVRDLLSMTCGQEDEAWPRGEWGAGMSLVRSFMNHPVPHRPGTRFHYNSLNTYMCSALVQRKS
ncbi:MAG: serine hydrolase, partial [Fimbriimonadaceae bacterium]|nr:serine hydrolase [Fimbriimonadaceae bacterium]